MNALVINERITHIGINDSKGNTHHFDAGGIHKTKISNSIVIPLNQLGTFRDVIITPEIMREADLRWKGTKYQDGKLTKKGLNNCYGYVAHVLTIATRTKITQNDIDRDVGKWLKANRGEFYDRLMKEQDPSYVPEADRLAEEQRRAEEEDLELQKALKISMGTHSKVGRGATRRGSDSELEEAMQLIKEMEQSEQSEVGRGATRRGSDSELEEAMQLIKEMEQSEFEPQPEPQPEPAPAMDEGSVGKLIELGFNREQAEAALAATGGDVRAATAYLLSGGGKSSKKKSKRKKRRSKRKKRRSKRRSKRR
jgi:hypothetical protein